MLEMPHDRREGDELDQDDVLIDSVVTEGEHDRQLAAELFAND